MKKTLAMLLAIVMVCGVMAGCGEKNSETMKWMSTTYAILTVGNEGDLDSIGGFKKNTMNKMVATELLKEWWSVTDRQTADDMIDWVLEEGHRVLFVEEMTEIKASGILELTDEEMDLVMDEMGFTAEDKEFYFEMISLYKDKGDKAIDAWDYSRAMQLLGYYYVADYYTKEETLDKSLEVAKIIQDSFSSWEEFTESYLNGHQYWQSLPASDSVITDRVAIYDGIKDGETSPYKIAWDTVLEKTW